MALLTNTLGGNSSPGTLFGGVRQRMADIIGLHSDVFRSASQNQDVGQAARAFSGARVTNDLTQTEGITQTATSENTKNITISDADPASIPAGFNFNFLQRVLTQVNARDLLSRSNLSLAQRQRVSQSGFAQGTDFQGNPSTVVNTITQDTGATQQTATSRTNTNITVKRDPLVEDAARFREVVADVRDSLVEAGVVAGQDQGSAEAPSEQIGRADGGVVNNFLNQNASGTQTNNSFMQNTIDLSENGTDTELSPRSMTKVVRIENDVVRNHGAASQTQGLLQVAEGGVDEFGNPTENGGNVNNVSRQTATFTENSTAMNTTSILA